MRIRASIILAALALVAAVAPPAKADAGYEIAFTPFLPVRTLLQNYGPMREFLERELNEPVTFVSAPDYRTDNQRIARQEYPFVVAVAHSACLAASDYGYIPLLRPRIPTRPLLLVRADSPIKAERELSGGVVAMSDPLAIVSMQGMQMLRQAGLSPAKDVRVVHQANHAAAVNMVLVGEAAAAIISDRALLQMPPEIQSGVRKVATWDKGAAPGVVYLANSGVPAERRERLRNAIEKFANDTPAGRELMNRLGYGGLVRLQKGELKALDPYAARLRVALRESRSTE